jgi:hypothetical protein
MKIKNTIIKSVLVFGLAFFTLTIHANIPSERKTVMTQTERMIQTSVKLISDLASDEKVEVLFSTGENGQVNFVLAKTKNPSLKKEIEKQFYTMSFSLLQKDAVNSVTISFKKI